jgi:hypothetical protein
VHEHEGWRGTVERAADRVHEPRAAPVEVSLLESLESVFAVRHQSGIFFW